METHADLLRIIVDKVFNDNNDLYDYVLDINDNDFLDGCYGGDLVALAKGIQFGNYSVNDKYAIYRAADDTLESFTQEEYNKLLIDNADEILECAKKLYTKEDN